MLQNVAARNGWHQFVSMQGFYNLLYREEEREMNPYCKATGVGLFPWSPLAAGVLAHPWSDRSDPRESSDPFLKLLFRSSEDGADKVIVGRVEELANKKGVCLYGASCPGLANFWAVHAHLWSRHQGKD